MKKTLVIFLSMAILVCAVPHIAFAATVTDNGLTYEVDDSSKTATLTSGTSVIVNLAIPESVNGYRVTAIGNNAFEPSVYNGSYLTSVTIPNSVTTIGVRAFSGCKRLETVTIGNGVTTIGRRAFSECESLTSVEIPDSVTNIGDGAFSGCSKLASINVDSANPNFKSADGVLFNKAGTELILYPARKTANSYTIPDTVTAIGNYAFQNCSYLTSVTIPNSVTTIGESAFDSCSGLTSVTIPDSVTTIGDRAFANCKRLPSVEIPNSVTTIGEWTFSNCGSLPSVTIPNSVTTIGGWAFNGCKGLTSVTIPDSVTAIGDYTFNGCSSLTSVTIPDSVTSIGEEAFMDCSGLTSVTIGNGVQTIGGWAFSDCGSLTSVTIPNSVTTIGRRAFSGCESLPSVEIPNSVTTIGDEAFYECSKLTSVTIPNSVTTIGGWAFAYCSKLTSVTIGSSVTTIGTDAFSNCSNLTSVTIPCNFDTGKFNSAGITVGNNNTFTNSGGGSGSFELTHDLGDWNVTRAATCTDAGEKTRSCKKNGCGKSETESVAALGHDMGDWNVTKAATCTDAGEKTRSCKNGCGKSENESVAALGHLWGDGVVTTPATPEKPGVKTYTCSRCGETKTEPVEYGDTPGGGESDPTNSHPDWGKHFVVNGIDHWVTEDGITSVEAVKELIWLRAECDGVYAWYCFDNTNGVFEDGSRVHVRWLSQKRDAKRYKELWSKLDDNHKREISPSKKRLLDIGVTSRAGKDYEQLNETVKFYVQIGDDWSKDGLQGYYLGESGVQGVAVGFKDKLTYPERSGVFGVMALKHFSPYIIYDKLTNVKPAVMAKRATIKTGDQMDSLVMSGMALLLISAYGVLVSFKPRRKRYKK